MDLNQTNGAPTSSEPSAPSAASPDVNWADFAVDVDDEGAFIADPVGELDSSGQAPASTAPVSPPAQLPPSEPAPTPAAPQQPPSPQAPPVQPPPQQPAETPPVQTPEELLANYRSGLETAYAISQDDALALATAPETVLPRLAANVHQRVMHEVAQQLQQMMTMVPQMLEARVAQQTAETEAKQVFYSAWPGLAAHHDRVVQNAALIRQANPQATKEQVIEMTGMMTAIALGLDPAAAKQGGQRTAPPAPRQAPAAPMAVPPHRPAAPGASVSSPPLQQQNVFASFADEDIDFLRG